LPILVLFYTLFLNKQFNTNSEPMQIIRLRSITVTSQRSKTSLR